MPKANELPNPTISNVETVLSPRMKRTARPTALRNVAVGVCMTQTSRNVDWMLAKTAAAMKKLAASIQIAFVAPIEAARTPAMTGPAISLHDERLASAPFAAGSRSGPTSAGTAPNAAASEKTYAVAASNATA